MKCQNRTIIRNADGTVTCLASCDRSASFQRVNARTEHQEHVCTRCALNTWKFIAGEAAKWGTTPPKLFDMFRIA